MADVDRLTADPPEVLVTGRDDLQRASWFAEGLPDFCAGFTSIADARKSAWSWYDERQRDEGT